MFDRHSPFLSKSSTDLTGLAEQTLRADIIGGRLRPGERLSEQALCQHYKFGRGVVRAALSRLAHQGFVSSQARSGWQVAPITMAGFREIALGRRQLEPLLASVALSAFDLERIDSLAAMQMALRQTEEIVQRRSYDRELRDLLASSLNAPLIETWLRQLWGKSDYYVGFIERTQARTLPPPDWTDFVAARRDRDPDRAALAIGHITGDGIAFIQSGLMQGELGVPVNEQKQKRASKPARPESDQQRPSDKRTL
jgi:DNA-binding GntR family transcriptional regulator